MQSGTSKYLGKNDPTFVKVSETLEGPQIQKFKVFSRILLLIFKPETAISEDELWNAALDFFSEQGQWSTIHTDFTEAFSKASETISLETKAQIGQIYLNYVKEHPEEFKNETQKALKCLYYVLSNALVFFGVVSESELPTGIGCKDDYFVNRYGYCKKFEEFASGLLEEAKSAIEAEDPNWTAPQ